MIIKVCGLTTPTQFLELDEMGQVDLLGIIFFNQSKRYVTALTIPSTTVPKVGVFVNQEVNSIHSTAKRYGIKTIQLHGDETPEKCAILKKEYTIIKAFGIDDSFNFDKLIDYQPVVDYFLFDTKTAKYGGSGRSFNWKILDQYQLDKPFILSGGINPKSLQSIREFHHPLLAGYDLNSGFETIPGVKDIDLLAQFIQSLKRSI